MRIIYCNLFALLFSLTVNAQEFADKVILKKGDVIKMSMDMLSTNTQSMMGGEPTEMKTAVKSLTVYEVMQVLPEGYIINKTMKNMKLDFEGFGQTFSYDSETSGKTDNPFIQQIANNIGVAEEMKLGLNGKEIEVKPVKDKKKALAKNSGKGMMKMMGMESGSSVVAGFLIIPKDGISTKAWEEVTEKDGLKTVKKYSLDGMMGNMAKVRVLSQTTGNVDISQNGMDMSTTVNTTSTDVILVDVQTGRVQMQTVNGNSNNKMKMNGTESPATGTVALTNAFE